MRTFVIVGMLFFVAGCGGSSDMSEHEIGLHEKHLTRIGFLEEHVEALEKEVDDLNDRVEHIEEYLEEKNSTGDNDA